MGELENKSNAANDGLEEIPAGGNFIIAGQYFSFFLRHNLCLVDSCVAEVAFVSTDYICLRYSCQKIHKKYDFCTIIPNKKAMGKNNSKITLCYSFIPNEKKKYLMFTF